MYSLIPLLQHPGITVGNIWHNGIGIFDAVEGLNTKIGNVSADKRLTSLHDRVSDLDGMALASDRHAVFKDWIDAVSAAGVNYRRLDRSAGILDSAIQPSRWRLPARYWNRMANHSNGSRTHRIPLTVIL